MKNLFLLATILYSLQGNAQNYQCLQGGVKRYYTNRNGYLRGMRIDSIRTSGTDIIYYPFHTARGKYIDIWTTPLDSNGGSWLGKKVIQQNDGTFLFDNIWNDTVIVKTGAHTGDSWTFYNDTTPKYYTATVMAEDTMTVLGGLDSIKTIRINAYNSSGLDPTDSINNFEITLSKNSGFVKVFDIYTFPYHRPDTAYTPNNDFYLDYVSSPPWGCLSSTPKVFSNLSFNLIALRNPTYAQLYDWNVGDRFENSIYSADYISDGTYPYGYYFDSITNKNITSSGIQYYYSGWIARQHDPCLIWSSFPPCDPYISHPYDTSGIGGILTFSNDLLIDTTIMPEEYNQSLLLYYFPDDTAYCRISDKYHSIEVGPYNSGILCSEGSPTTKTYKTGIGLVKYNWNILGGSPPLIQDTTLLYYVKSGVPCGRYTFPSPINYITGIVDVNKISFAVFPNPATEELTIKTNSTKSYTITLQNMLGQVIITQQTTKQQQTINVASIPAGIYFVNITDDQGNRHTEKLLIAH